MMGINSWFKKIGNTLSTKIAGLNLNIGGNLDVSGIISGDGSDITLSSSSIISALTYTPEDINNKEDIVIDNSYIKYPTNNLVKNQLALKQDIIEGEPNGFVNRNDVILSWSDTTRTLTITPATISFSIYSNGLKFIKSTIETYQIPDTTANYYIYYDSNGNLAHNVVFNPNIIDVYCIISTIYWNATLQKTIPDALNELHGIEMPAEVHSYLHSTRGTVYQNGLSPSVVADANGSLLLHIQVSGTSGTIWDEDIKHTISPRAIEDNIPVLYRTGSTGIWNINETSSAMVRTTGTGRAAYNQWTGAEWKLTEVSNNNYTLAHLYSFPGINKKWFIMMGQAIYTKTADARAAASVELLNISGLPLAEFKAIASFVIQTSDSYTNIFKSRVISIAVGETFVDWRMQLPVGTPGSSALANSIVVVPTGNIIATDVQTALVELDADNNQNIIATSINYLALITDKLIEVTTGIDTININLPPAISWTGKVINILKIDNGIGTFNIIPDGSETINGVSNLAGIPIVPLQWTSISVISNGTNIRIL